MDQLTDTIQPNKLKSLAKNKWVWIGAAGVAFLAWYLNRGTVSSGTNSVADEGFKAPAYSGGGGGGSSSGGGLTQEQMLAQAKSNADAQVNAGLDKFGNLTNTNAALKEMTNMYLADAGLSGAIESERKRLIDVEAQKKLIANQAAQNEDTRQSTSELKNLMAIGGDDADIGVGGYNYATANAVSKQQMQYQSKQLTSDESYRQSEKERAENVIKERKQRGIDTTQQEKYLQSINTKQAAADKAAADAEKKAQADIDKKAASQFNQPQTPPPVLGFDAFDSGW